MGNFLDRDLKWLPLYGDVRAGDRLLHTQRLGLEVRAAYVKRMRAEGVEKIDPVLRFHLGLEAVGKDGGRRG